MEGRPKVEPEGKKDRRVLMARRANDKAPDRTPCRLRATKANGECQLEGVMRKLIPALKIVLVVTVVFLAAVTVLGLVLGAEKPFQPVFPMLMGLLAIGLLSGSSLPAPKCPTCETQQPPIRTPKSFRQLVWGGWTCTQCGTEIDRHGRAIDKAASR